MRNLYSIKKIPKNLPTQFRVTHYDIDVNNYQALFKTYLAENDFELHPVTYKSDIV